MRRPAMEASPTRDRSEPFILTDGAIGSKSIKITGAEKKTLTLIHFPIPFTPPLAAFPPLPLPLRRFLCPSPGPTSCASPPPLVLFPLAAPLRLPLSFRVPGTARRRREYDVVQR